MVSLLLLGQHLLEQHPHKAKKYHLSNKPPTKDLIEAYKTIQEGLSRDFTRTQAGILLADEFPNVFAYTTWGKLRRASLVVPSN